MRPRVYPQRAPQVNFEHFPEEDEVLLLDLRDKQYYTLNETAAAFWLRADGTRSFEEIVAELQESYEAEAEALHEVMAALCADLSQAGLLIEHESAVEAGEGSERQ